MKLINIRLTNNTGEDSGDLFPTNFDLKVGPEFDIEQLFFDQLQNFLEKTGNESTLNINTIFELHDFEINILNQKFGDQCLQNNKIKFSISKSNSQWDFIVNEKAYINRLAKGQDIPAEYQKLITDAANSADLLKKLQAIDPPADSLESLIMKLEFLQFRDMKEEIIDGYLKKWLPPYIQISLSEILKLSDMRQKSIKQPNPVEFGETYFAKLSSKSGFNKLYIEKCYRILELINDIFKDSLLRQKTILAGDSAFNLMFHKFAHIPISLHLSFLDNEDTFKKDYHSLLFNIINSKKYTVKDVSDTEKELKYINILNQPDSINLFIEYNSGSYAFNPVINEFLNPFTNSKYLVNYSSLEETVAKIIISIESCFNYEDYLNLYKISITPIPYNLNLVHSIYIYKCKNPRFLEDIFQKSITQTDNDEKILPLQQNSAHLEIKQLNEKIDSFIKIFRNINDNQKAFIKNPVQANLSLIFNPAIINKLLNNKND
ncbi:MAG: hypothetical protein PHV30_05575 [Candidatus Margulisbacteria bacterium]|nr:hypothetical protein [Candidatus Margulisiibacteriota bacterium]